MIRHLYILLFLTSLHTGAQPPKLEVSNGSFEAFTVSMPAMKPDRFIEITKAWAYAFTRAEGGYDASNVAGNSITISAFKRNGFRYQNTGDTVENKIRYSLAITFTGSSYTLKVSVDDIYGRNDTLLEYKLPDYYTSEGRLKEGYEGLETSLEQTVNDMVQSHYSYVINYK